MGVYWGGWTSANGDHWIRLAWKQDGKDLHTFVPEKNKHYWHATIESRLGFESWVIK